MSALHTAESRTLEALGRLESALRAAADRTDGGTPDGPGDAELRRQRAILQAQCEGLREELAALRQRHDRLVSAFDEIDERLDGAIARVEDIVGG